jgi:putative PIN family toxin of toxin-antitoxin system
MKVVVDTNVLVSGVFFGGMPSRILEAWREKRIDVVVSPDILEEYRRVGEHLETQFTDVSLAPFLALLVMNAEIIEPPDLPEQVSRDSDDDKFIACALAGGCHVIISSDKDLLSISGYRGVKVVAPREFLESVL